MFLWNFGAHLPDYTEPYTRRLQWHLKLTFQERYVWNEWEHWRKSSWDKQTVGSLQIRRNMDHFLSLLCLNVERLLSRLFMQQPWRAMEGVGIQCLKQEENLVILNKVNRTQLFRTNQKLSDLNSGSLQRQLQRHLL